MSRTVKHERTTDREGKRAAERRASGMGRAANVAGAVIAAVMIATSLRAGVRVTARPVVNVNTASVEQIALLPGVGPKLANEIYAYAEAGQHMYEQSAPVESECDHRCHFKSVSDLDKVKGVGAKKLQAMLPYVVVTGETTATGKLGKHVKVNGLRFVAPNGGVK